MKKIIFILLALTIFLVGCSCQDCNVMNTKQLFLSKESYLNQEIQIEVTPQVYKKLCTHQLCPEEEPCCNSCSAQLSINYNEEIIPIIGTTCSGNNCELSCEPIKQNQEKIIKGKLTEAGFEVSDE